MKKLKKVLVAVLVIIMLFSTYKIITYYITGLSEEKAYKVLKETEPDNLEAYNKDNKDIIGWIKIKGTKIDYPVLQTPDDPQYYLRRNFKKEDAISGSIFVDGNSDIKTSKNILIYGHNMKNGSMFSDLLKYKKEDFLKEHKYIEFNTLEGKGKYKVIAGGPARIESKNSEKFKYYDYAQISTEAKFLKYLKGFTNNSDYAFIEHVRYGDKLITLSTCDFKDDKQGRYTVLAKKIK